MRTRIGFFVICGLAAISTQASATSYVLSVSGKVDQISTLQNLVPVSTPNGVISVGDIYSLRATFDTDTAEIGALFDADPTINVYSLPGAQITAQIGSYVTSFSPGFSFNASFQLWNDYVVVNPTDTQSFNFFNYNLSPAIARPFEMGSGLTSESLTFNAFDFGAKARTNDLITDIVPLSNFANKSLNYGILNFDTNLFVYINAQVSQATLTAVPEPATWAMMIVGFGIIGGSMRRRQSLAVTHA